jgi:hypothetical protein
MDQPSTEPKSKAKSITRTRWYNFPALFKDLWDQHRRKKPLGEAPGVRESIIAIFKTSCEHHPPADTPFTASDISVPGLNVLLIFIPLSVRVFFEDDFAEPDGLSCL